MSKGTFKNDFRFLLIFSVAADAVAYLVLSIARGFGFSVLLGLLAGTAGACFNLLWLNMSCESAAAKYRLTGSEGSAKRTVAAGYAGRMILMCAVISAAFLLRGGSVIDPIGTVIPFFYPRIAMLIKEFLPEKRDGKEE